MKKYHVKGYFIHKTPQFVEKNDYEILVSIVYGKGIPKSTKVLAINMGPFSFGYKTSIFEHMVKNFERHYLENTPETIKNLGILLNKNGVKRVSSLNFPLYIGWAWKAPEFLALLKRGL